MSIIVDFVDRAKTIVEELSREDLPGDVALQEVMKLERLAADAVAALTIVEEPPKP